MPLQEEQEREDLDGLPEAHVVGEAAAEAEPREEPQPAHALALVRAERRVQRVARIGLFRAAPAAQLGEGLREPRPGLDARPFSVRLGFGLPVRDRRPRGAASPR